MDAGQKLEKKLKIDDLSNYWAADKSVSNCTLCHKKFTVTLRRSVVTKCAQICHNTLE